MSYQSTHRGGRFTAPRFLLAGLILLGVATGIGSDEREAAVGPPVAVRPPVAVTAEAAEVESAWAGLRTAPPPVTDAAATASGASPLGPQIEAMLGGRLEKSLEGLQIVERPDGSRTIDLRGRWLTLSLIDVEGGDVHVRCVSSADEAGYAFRAPSTRRPHAEER
jgi:hypothetical protein